MPPPRHDPCLTRPDPWLSFRPWAVGALLIAIAGVTVLTHGVAWLGATGMRSVVALDWHGLERGWLWQLATCHLVHEHAGEMCVAMVLLWLAGRQLEPLIGARHFLGLFFCSGLGGAALRLAGDPWGQGDPILGALPGAAGVAAAFFAVLPADWIELRAGGRRLWRARRGWVFAVLLVVLTAAQSVARADWIYLPAHAFCAVIGWIYVRRLGCARPARFERLWEEACARRRHLAALDAREFIRLEIDPILDRITRGGGVGALRQHDRRLLRLARVKIERGRHL